MFNALNKAILHNILSIEFDFGIKREEMFRTKLVKQAAPAVAAISNQVKTVKVQLV